MYGTELCTLSLSKMLLFSASRIKYKGTVKNEEANPFLLFAHFARAHFQFFGFRSSMDACLTHCDGQKASLAWLAARLEDTKVCTVKTHSGRQVRQNQGLIKKPV